ncbi:MAG: heparan-alpha-glucosaminide N-acetyltransferase domain-containing protein [Planctomycetales bacterium]
MSAPLPRARIDSMDQFRGYTVAGMFLVNYIGDYPFAHSYADGFLAHMGTHFTWADSIMPSFMFCAGFSYRLTAPRRFQELGVLRGTWSYIRRSLALVAISLCIFGFGEFQEYAHISLQSIQRMLTRLVCSQLWETLAIIGVCQLLLLPIILLSFRARVVALFGLMAFHVWMSYSFGYAFQSRAPNWVTSLTGLPGGGLFDGGLFGPFGWTIPMLGGTLAYDVVASHSAGAAARRLLVAGLFFMLLGYGLNCLTRLYDKTPAQKEEIAKLQAELRASSPQGGGGRGRGGGRGGWGERRGGRFRDPDLPEDPRRARLRELTTLKDPVIPHWERWKSPGIGWAEPPFVRPPNENFRFRNYWMMAKGRVTLPFTTFALGFALTLYSLCVWVCDVGHFGWSVFRTLGLNPLAGYVIHEVLLLPVHGFAPSNSPVWYAVLSFLFFFWLNWLALRSLEKQKLFFRM